MPTFTDKNQVIKIKSYVCLGMKIHFKGRFLEVLKGKFNSPIYKALQ